MNKVVAIFCLVLGSFIVVSAFFLSEVEDFSSTDSRSESTNKVTKLTKLNRIFNLVLFGLSSFLFLILFAVERFP